MRKVRLLVAMSLDGYIARPDGAVDWLDRIDEGSAGEDYGMREVMASVDTCIMGRKTLDVARKLGGTGATPGMRTLVFSRKKHAAIEGVEFVSGDVAAQVKALRNTPGKDIWLMGGGELTREFLKAAEIDRITVHVIPVLLGQGIPLFPASFPETALELTECNTYKSGLVSLTYAVVPVSVEASQPAVQGRARGTAKPTAGGARPRRGTSPRRRAGS